MDLDTVADELYLLPPAEFTAKRDAFVADARRGGDEALAQQIKQLRKPTAGAALVNALATERQDIVDRLFEVGDAMRTAQASGAGDDLRQSMRARQQAIRDLIAAAGVLAKARGATVSAGIAREIQTTFLAASADPDAEAAVRAGRLTAGIGVGDGSGPESAAGVPSSPRPKRAQRDDMALRRAWREAREASLEAQRDADRADREVSEAEAGQQEIEGRLRDLQAEIDRLTREKATARDAVAAAKKVRTEAQRVAKAAAARADKAEAATKSPSS